MSGIPYSAYRGINVGSGPHYAKGWFNTDVTLTDEGTQPDMLVNIFDMPEKIGRQQFETAYVGHVLEHIDWELVPDAIRCITTTVKSGGVIMFVGPCMEKAIATGQPQSLLDSIECHPEVAHHPWAHSWTPTEDKTLDRIMAANCLSDIRIMNIRDVRRPLWPNPTTAAWQTAISGIA